MTPDLIEIAAMNYRAMLERNPAAADMITKEEYIKTYVAQCVQTATLTSTGGGKRDISLKNRILQDIVSES